LHRHLVNSGGCWSHSEDTIERSSSENIRCLLRDFSELEVSDFRATDDDIILTDETSAATSAVLQRKTLAVLGEPAGRGRIVVTTILLAIGTGLAWYPQVRRSCVIDHLEFLWWVSDQNLTEVLHVLDIGEAD